MSIRPNDGDAMELDCRYVLHIPLSKWENGEVVPLDVDDEIEELIFCLEVQGFDGFYLTKVKSHYKSRRLLRFLQVMATGHVRFSGTGFFATMMSSARRHLQLKSTTG